jgi:excisionase family DNA binding protein
MEVKAMTEDILVYTPKEFFRLIGVSKNTGYELLRSGAVRCIKVGLGRKILIPRQSVADWLAGGERHV